ncbi:MAG: GNAT family N-acetyltransferase [Burkholderiales bacterium]|nr:GNAT family N-acetyltransferase [Burkholderiales bacterium]
MNSAYRGESSRAGWTTEADLLGGQRTDIEEVESLIEKPDSMILVCSDGAGIAGSVHLEKSGDCALLGMLAVRPRMQGRGMGKRMLAEAEKAASKIWGCGKTKMTVLTYRAELIAFYERRGYRRTGIFKPFPEDPGFGIPKVEGLRLEWLEKNLF